MKVLIVILPAILISSSCRRAGSTYVTPVKPTLAIELPARGAEAPPQLPVPENGGSGTELSADPLPGLTTTPLPLSVAANSNGGQVTAEVYVIGPESNRLRYTDGHKKLLGHYFARANESIILNELTKLGYQPITLKVVPYTPPPSAHPELISKVPSVQITLTDDPQPYMAMPGTGSCSVVLHNLSSHGVMAWILRYGTGSTETIGSYDRPALAPHGVSRNQRIIFGRTGRMTARGEVFDPPGPQQVIVAAAIFTDGSHEGDDIFAARLEAQQIGKRVVGRIVTPLIDKIVGDHSLNDEVRTARIKEEIFRVSSDPDAAAKRAMQEKFPRAIALDLVTDLNRCLDAQKNAIWSDLYGYMNKCCQYPPPDHVSVAQWWSKARHRVEPPPNSSN